jgi:hypothetical protein
MRDLIVTSALSRRLRGWFSAAGGQENMSDV